MAGDQVQELLEAPSDFAKNGIQFMRRCTKRTSDSQLEEEAELETNEM